MKKPTKFFSNFAEVLKSVKRRCTGRGGACSAGGYHRITSAVYPFLLCKPTLRGLRKQLRVDHRLYDANFRFQNFKDHKERFMEQFHDESRVVGLDSEGYEMDLGRPELNAVGFHEVFEDAITGQVLDPQLVRHASNEELSRLEFKGCLAQEAAL